MLGPMKLMIASEFASTGELEISVFQRLSLANGRNPLRLAPCPVLMAPQALWLLLPEPEPPPDPPPLPDPLPPLPELPPDDSVDAPELVPPPQFTHEKANASTLEAASSLIQENCMTLLSQETAAKPREVRPIPRRKGDMYHQHLGGLDLAVAVGSLGLFSPPVVSPFGYIAVCPRSVTLRRSPEQPLCPRSVTCCRRNELNIRQTGRQMVTCWFLDVIQFWKQEALLWFSTSST